MSQLNQLEATVTKILFSSEKEHGHKFVICAVDTKKGKDKVIGTFSDIQENLKYTFFGNYTDHSKFGKQFNAEYYEMSSLNSENDIINYLGSGLFFGIGDSTARKIVKKFGLNTLDVLDNNINKLIEIKGISQNKLDKITETWNEKKILRPILIELSKYGVTTNTAMKIYNKYGSDTLHVINSNPYRLILDIDYLGFKKVDTIALNMGIPHDSNFRIEAGIVHQLREITNNGHTCIPKDELIEDTLELLGVDENKIYDNIDILYAKNVIFIDRNNYIYLKYVWNQEKEIVDDLSNIINTPKIENVERNILLDIIKNVENKLDIMLSDEQKDTVISCIYNKVTIVTGSGGSGKTTVTRFIVEILDNLNLSYKLASPTGRASKRMEELTGKSASTIHRLLGYNPESNSFLANRYCTIESNYFIIDEMSMVDTYIMNSLIQAIPYHASIIFIGDYQQLPSVGAGKVFNDLIESNIIPVMRLIQIYRQNGLSNIVVTATKIIEGMPIKLEENYNNTGFKNDFHFIEEDDPEIIENKIVDLIKNELPQKYNFDSLNDIQLLIPMYKGKLGIDHYNTVLQNALNCNIGSNNNYLDNGFGKRFYKGDKVIQLKNNYNKGSGGVFNGDVGIIVSVNKFDNILGIKFNCYDEIMYYEQNEFNQLSLAYSMSIHKCVTGDTIINTKKGLEYISDIVGDINLGHMEKEIEIETQNGVYKTNQVFKGIEEDCIKITTESGFELTGSYRHPILIRNSEGEEIWKKLPELEINDIVVLKKGLNNGNSDEFDLTKLIYDTSKLRKQYLIPNKMSEDLAWWLGVIIGDGCITDKKNEGRIEVSKPFLDLIEKYETISSTLFKVFCTRRLQRNLYNSYFHSVYIKKFLIDIVGLKFVKSIYKTIPSSIMVSSSKNQISFIRGLFDTDGGVSKNVIHFTTASEILSKEVQIMLLNLGILGSRRRLKFGYRIQISGENARKFVKIINFFESNKKRKAIQRFGESKLQLPKVQKGSFPDSEKFARKLREDLLTDYGYKYGNKKNLRIQNNKYIGKLLSRFINNQCLLYPEHIDYINTQLPKFFIKESNKHYLKYINLIFEKVVKIEFCKKQVYDLSVPEKHSYISNGIVSHNSQGSEYPCIVMVVSKSHFIMLKRNLLYTGITRSRQQCYVIGTKQAFFMAVNNNEVQMRYTGLKEKLKNSFIK